MRTADRERNQIRAYVEDQANEAVVHLEKVGSEVVGLNRHDMALLTFLWVPVHDR